MTDNSETLVYLVRHGEAKPKGEDPERPLSEVGEDDVVRMAVWAAETGNHVAAIWHSGKLRAQQTVKVFADQLPESPVVLFKIGFVEVVIAILFLIPRTAFTGTLLLTAYLG